MKKHYLIYQITNTVNNKIYIGKHITENIDDDYFGSGKLLSYAKEKYGIDKFIKTILFELQNEEEMNLLEKCVVTPDFCARKDTYNINVGGDGGWSYINKLRKKNPSIRQQHYYNFAHGSREYCHTQDFSNAVSNGLKSLYRKHPEKHGTTGKHWKSQKASNNMKDPTKNSMIGKCWIHNIETFESKVWPKEKDLPYGWAVGRKPPKPDIRNRNSSAFGHVWINDGHNNKFVKNKVIEEYLKQGWVKGRLIK